ncbi:MAG: hypothetical protein GX363_10270 [Clostridiales bacterium]|nr:hypothetical protein [Clostridiales bacterium]
MDITTSLLLCEYIDSLIQHLTCYVLPYSVPVSASYGRPYVSKSKPSGSRRLAIEMGRHSLVGWGFSFCEIEGKCCS